MKNSDEDAKLQEGMRRFKKSCQQLNDDYQDLSTSGMFGYIVTQLSLIAENPNATITQREKAIKGILRVAVLRHEAERREEETARQRAQLS